MDARQFLGTVREVSAKYNELASAGADAFQETEQAIDQAAEGSNRLAQAIKAAIAAYASWQSARGITGAVLEADAAAKSAAGSLGELGRAAQEVDAVARSLFERGLVGNLTEGYDLATAAAKKFKTASVAELSDITAQAQALQAQFGDGFGQQLAAVQELSGRFGVSFTQSFDLIAAGYQRGLNGSGDFLESLTEYGPQFADAGFSADEFFSVLETGAANGVLGTDKIADAVKEFRIKFNESTDDIRQGYAALGLNQDDLQRQVSSGAVSIADVFEVVVQRLNGLGDATVQNTTGVALIGTQFEDLTATVLANVDTQRTKLRELAGSVNQVVTSQQTLGAAFQSGANSFQSGISGSQTLRDAYARLAAVITQNRDLLKTLGAAIAGIAAFFLNISASVLEFVSANKEAILVVGALVLAMKGLLILQAIIKVVTLATTAFRGLGLSLAALRGISLIISLITGLSAAFGGLTLAAGAATVALGPVGLLATVGALSIAIGRAIADSELFIDVVDRITGLKAQQDAALKIIEAPGPEVAKGIEEIAQKAKAAEKEVLTLQDQLQAAGKPFLARIDGLNAQLGQIDKKYAASSSRLAKQVADRKKSEHERVLDAARESIDAALKAEQDYAQKIKRLRQELADQAQSDEDRLAEIRQKGMSDAQKELDNERRAREKLAEANQAAAQGDTERAKQLADSVKDIAESLERSGIGEELFQEAAAIGQDAMKAQLAEAERTQEQIQDILTGQDQKIQVKAEIEQALQEFMVIEDRLRKLNQLAKLNVTASGVGGGGGRPLGFATGGRVPGAGSQDTVPAMLTPGEFVINKKASGVFGPLLERMNSGQPLRAFANGGWVNPGKPMDSVGGGAGMMTINLNLGGGQPIRLMAERREASRLAAILADAGAGL